MLAIHRTGLVTVQVGTIAAKGDQVSHGLVTRILPLPYGRGSA
jgi:hypothetical protein